MATIAQSREEWMSEDHSNARAFYFAVAGSDSRVGWIVALVCLTL